MEMTAFLPAVTTAVTVGLGCGTCCSPIISTFLSTYVVSHSNGVQKGLLSFLSFFVGKLVSVTLLCIIAAALGKQFISQEGYIGVFNLRLAAQLVMSGIGAVLALHWLLEQKTVQKSCDGCRNCKKANGKAGVIPMLCAGLTYGCTPCAPLLLMIGYAFTLPLHWAGITGMVFSLSSMASPVLVLTVITGVLSKKMFREIPSWIKWFRLGSYILLMVMPFCILL